MAQAQLPPVIESSVAEQPMKSKIEAGVLKLDIPLTHVIKTAETKRGNLLEIFFEHGGWSGEPLPFRVNGKQLYAKISIYTRS